MVLRFNSTGRVVRDLPVSRFFAILSCISAVPIDPGPRSLSSIFVSSHGGLGLRPSPHAATTMRAVRPRCQRRRTHRLGRCRSTYPTPANRVKGVATVCRAPLRFSGLCTTLLGTTLSILRTRHRTGISGLCSGTTPGVGRVLCRLRFPELGPTLFDTLRGNTWHQTGISGVCCGTTPRVRPVLCRPNLAKAERPAARNPGRCIICREWTEAKYLWVCWCGRGPFCVLSGCAGAHVRRHHRDSPDDEKAAAKVLVKQSGETGDSETLVPVGSSSHPDAAFQSGDACQRLELASKKTALGAVSGLVDASSVAHLDPPFCHGCDGVIPWREVAVCRRCYNLFHTWCKVAHLPFRPGTAALRSSVLQCTLVYSCVLQCTTPVYSSAL